MKTTVTLGPYAPVALNQFTTLIVGETTIPLLRGQVYQVPNVNYENRDFPNCMMGFLCLPCLISEEEEMFLAVNGEKVEKLGGVALKRADQSAKDAVPGLEAILHFAYTEKVTGAKWEVQ